MKKALTGALATIILGLATAVALIQNGMLDVSADTPHSSYVASLIDWARERAIARSAQDIIPPADLANPERIRRGAGNYDAMCASCHLSPGVADSEIRKGLYPQPPNLSRVAASAREYTQADARRFWIIKHGIKASGMPAWGKGGVDDESIWDLSAFLNAMPAMSAAQYRQQVNFSNGHSHGHPDH